MIKNWKQAQAKLIDILGDKKIKAMRQFLKDDRFKDLPDRINISDGTGHHITHTSGRDMQRSAECHLALVDAKTEAEYNRAFLEFTKWLDNDPL